MVRALEHQAEQPRQVLGCFDDRCGERLNAAARPLHLGGLDAVAAQVRLRKVQEVYITLPNGHQPRMARLVAQLQDTTASLYLVPEVPGTSTGIIQGRLDVLGGMPVVGLCDTPFRGLNAALKRGSDLLLASLILLLIAPLMAAIALGIRCSSPGPVIFKQRRNGLGGEEIVVYKFRTMRTLEDGARVVQAVRGDSRITPFGALLRKTSMDELPQFINVLQGSMSIVGPRPHAVAHNERFRPLIPGYSVRHKVKPGITGWAQVNGHRGETDTLQKMQARVDFDLAYLRDWSLALDLRIILRTVWLVFFDRNAY
jgi:putative colanic acid biosynthesis UDP-glucose lipid carrier transferase